MRPDRHKAGIAAGKITVGIREIQGIDGEKTGADNGILISSDAGNNQIKGERTIGLNSDLCNLIGRTGTKEGRNGHSPSGITNRGIIEVNRSRGRRIIYRIIIHEEGDLIGKMQIRRIRRNIHNGISATSD